MDQKRLADRVKGRQEAAAIIELIQDTAISLPSSDAIVTFCETLIEAHISKNKTLPAANPRGPMTDGETNEFRRCVMQFGKFTGEMIANVPLKYLDWLAGAQEESARQLFRYLKNEKIAECLRVEIDECSYPAPKRSAGN